MTLTDFLIANHLQGHVLRGELTPEKCEELKCKHDVNELERSVQDDNS